MLTIKCMLKGFYIKRCFKSFRLSYQLKKNGFTGLMKLNARNWLNYAPSFQAVSELLTAPTLI